MAEEEDMLSYRSGEGVAHAALKEVDHLDIAAHRLEQERLPKRAERQGVVSNRDGEGGVVLTLAVANRAVVQLDRPVLDWEDHRVAVELRVGQRDTSAVASQLDHRLDGRCALALSGEHLGGLLEALILRRFVSLADLQRVGLGVHLAGSQLRHPVEVPFVNFPTVAVPGDPALPRVDVPDVLPVLLDEPLAVARVGPRVVANERDRHQNFQDFRGRPEAWMRANHSQPSSWWKVSSS